MMRTKGTARALDVSAYDSNAIEQYTYYILQKATYTTAKLVASSEVYHMDTSRPTLMHSMRRRASAKEAPTKFDHRPERGHGSLCVRCRSYDSTVR